MKWSDLPLKPTDRALRQFAGAWLIIFLAAGVYRYVARGQHGVGIAVGVMAIVIGGMGLIWPAAVRWLFVGATVLAFPIGFVVSQVMLAVMYYGILTPLAFGFAFETATCCPASRRQTAQVSGRPSTRPKIWAPTFANTKTCNL